MKKTKFFLIACLSLTFSLSWANDVDISKDSHLTETDLSYDESNLLSAPTTTIKESFTSELKQKKYPLNLGWTNIDGAEFYEVEITRGRNCSRRYFKTAKNNLHIEIYPKARYLWRVMAYSNGKILTEYSPKHKLFLDSPLGDHITSKVEAPYASDELSSDEGSQNTASCSYPSAETLNKNAEVNTEPEVPKELNNIVENTTEEEPVTTAAAPVVEEEKKVDRVPAYSYANKYSLWGRSWVKGGASFNGYFHNQDLGSGNEITHETVTSPALYGEFGTFIGSKFGLVINGTISTGDFEDENGLIKESYTTQRLAAEAIYLLGSDWKTTKSSQFHLKFGIGYSSTPIIEALSATNSFGLVDSKAITVRAGLGYKNRFTNKFRPELGLTLAYPVSFATNGNSLEIDSGYTIDFTAGINYQLYKNYQIGLFWQTEVNSLDYTQDDNSNTLEGSAFIINNHLGVYLGLEF